MEWEEVVKRDSKKRKKWERRSDGGVWMNDGDGRKGMCRPTNLNESEDEGELENYKSNSEICPMDDM
ncbi:uncharacterized protein G2W53_026684 [Senna tora]|uniref:Uncharacterized protein n=1 Tax=Senna tora TaxID=362788 RepID=A0A834THL1_9FABA|nr:uncharacterized protein G2W53_026684 [Senna tora]